MRGFIELLEKGTVTDDGDIQDYEPVPLLSPRLLRHSVFPLSRRVNPRPRISLTGFASKNASASIKVEY